MENPRQRAPRFERMPEPPTIRITERDMEILRAVRTHRLLRSDQIHTVAGGSRQRILRRLQALFHNGFLDRPRAQIEYYRPGSRPMTYALGARAEKLLSTGEARQRLPAQNDVKRLFLEHTLFVADIVVALENQCRTGSVRFISREEIVATALAEGRSFRAPLKWSVMVRTGEAHEKLGVIPDQIFGLRPSNAPPEYPTAYFFLEADRGTMPIVRSGMDRTSLFRKLLAYEASWRQGLHRQHFGFSRFCVLFVTMSRARTRALMDAASRINSGRPPRIFLFATAPEFLRDPMNATLINSANENTTLTQVVDG